MGLFDSFKAGVKDVKDTVSSTKFDTIEKFDPSGKELILRYPAHGSAEIMSGTTLLVRESQSAVFFTEGKAMDVFGPGSHQLTTKVLPVISKYIDMALFSQGKSPFRSEIYFVNHTVYRNLKWGTKEPVYFRDAEFGPVKLRSFGEFSMKIGHGDNVNLFINRVVGTQSMYTTKDVETYIKGIIVARLNDVLGETLKGKSILDLPAYYDEISAALKARIRDDLGADGLEIVQFTIGAITPPPQVQEMWDKSAGMAAIRDAGKYQQIAAADAMTNISKQEGARGSAMGQMMEMGMGLAAAGGMMQQIQKPQQQQQYAPQQQQYAPPQQQMGPPCPNCQNPLPQGAKFCASCGTKIGGGAPCPNCQNPLPQGAKFCASCGTKIDAGGVCSSCQAQLAPGAKFCPSCGTPTAPQEITCSECQAKLAPGTKFCASCGTKVG